MTIYILIIFFILLGIFFENNDKKKKYYCIFITIFLTFISGFRSYQGITCVGGDTEIYANMFERVSMMSFDKVLNTDFDTGFFIFIKCLSVIINSPTFMFVVIAGLFMSSVSILVYKYSKRASLSYLLLFSFYYFQFSMTGMRQTLAMATLFFSLIFLLEEKRLAFSICVLLASTFHSTALIFIVVYFFKNIQLKKNYIYLCVIFLVIIFVFKGSIAAYIINVIKYRDYYVENTSNGFTMLFVYLVTYLFILFTQYLVNNKEKINGLFIVMLTIGVSFEILKLSQTIFFRIAMYFSIVIIILFPNYLKMWKVRDNNKIIDILVYSIFLIMYFNFTIYSAHTYPYAFFWR